MRNITFYSSSLVAASLLTASGVLAATGPATATTPSSAVSSSIATVSASSASEIAVTSTTFNPLLWTNVIKGTATPNAEIGVTIDKKSYSARAAADGTWSITAISLIRSSYDGSAFEIVGDETHRVSFTLRSTAPSDDVAAPVVTTKVYEDAGGPFIRVSGTGVPGALIALELGRGIYNPTVGSDGTWSATNVLRPSTIEATGTISQVSGDSLSPTVPFRLLSAETSDSVQPPVVTTTSYARDRFISTIKGTGTPGALVGLRVNGNSYSATVATDGTWSIAPVVGLIASSYDVTAFQIVGGYASPEANARLDAEAAVSPVEVADPANPAVGYQPNSSFTFRGTADRLADTVTVRNFSGTKIAAVPVDPATGDWSWTRPNLGTSTWKLSFISHEGKDDEAVTTLADFKPATPPSAVKPIAFTNPANPADGYTPNTSFTFRGTATPGAMITLSNDKGTVVAKDILAGGDGTWSWTRANLGTSIWKITATADAGTPNEQRVTLAPFAPAK